jgi:pyruvate dehydrogenase E1 component beta subunit
VTGELVAIVSDEAFDYLDAPVKRVGAAEIPVPFSPPLEMPTIPDVERVVQVVQSIRN